MLTHYGRQHLSLGGWHRRTLGICGYPLDGAYTTNYSAPLGLNIPAAVDFFSFLIYNVSCNRNKTKGYVIMVLYVFLLVFGVFYIVSEKPLGFVCMRKLAADKGEKGYEAFDCSRYAKRLY